jgi:hypothetical protein
MMLERWSSWLRRCRAEVPGGGAGRRCREDAEPKTGDSKTVARTPTKLHNIATFTTFAIERTKYVLWYQFFVIATDCTLYIAMGRWPEDTIKKYQNFALLGMIGNHLIIWRIHFVSSNSVQQMRSSSYLFGTIILRFGIPWPIHLRGRDE